MKAQREYGLSLSWARVTTVFLIDVALLVIASHLPDSWQADRNLTLWIGVGLTVIITVVALLTNGGVPVSSAPIARIRNWYADPEALTVGCTPAVDHRRQYSRETVGIREHAGKLIAVIAVDGVGEAGRHRHRDTLATTIPLEAVVTSLRQFDVRLDSVDIISVGTRKAAKGVKSAVSDDFGADGDRRPIEERNTWLVVRMDPQHNVSAVAARDSVACTLAAATERLAHDLDGRSCVARPLSAEDIVNVDEAVLAGLQPANVRPFWRYLKTPDGFVTSFWVSPGDITSKTLEELWLTDADTTVMTIRIIAEGHEADVSVWVRYHSDKRLRKEAFTGLNRLTGRQLGAIAASLPAPTSHRPLPMPSRTLGHAEDILVPVGAVAGEQASGFEALR
jgi:type VII secretion protein EccE